MTNILITGATGGIGSATARRFAESGSTVLLHTFQNVPKAESIAAEIEKAGAKVRLLTADFMQPNAADDLYRQALEHVEHVDVLVNAAGADLMSASVRPLPFEEKLQLLWHVDVSVPIRLSKKIAEGGKADDRKRLIVFFSWNGVDYGWRGETAQLYGAAKGALQGFSRSFAQTVAPNVRVCCLSLGWVKTRWGDTVANSGQREAGYAADSLLNRWGTPEEVAEVIRFLADNKSAFLDASRLYLDGGKTFSCR
ncbi:3-oxoacyl-ACP reductase [Planctomycetales bacterium]|nr:3-oxoacyl-ACP reductase [Planctomycetales bacterium]